MNIKSKELQSFIKDIFAEAIKSKTIPQLFPTIQLDIDALIQDQSTAALFEIKQILENDTLNDFECIEQIVCVFEKFGSDCGNRHDFG